MRDREAQPLKTSVGEIPLRRVQRPPTTRQVPGPGRGSGSPRGVEDLVSPGLAAVASRRSTPEGHPCCLEPRVAESWPACRHGSLTPSVGLGLSVELRAYRRGLCKDLPRSRPRSWLRRWDACYSASRLPGGELLLCSRALGAPRLQSTSPAGARRWLGRPPGIRPLPQIQGVRKNAALRECRNES